MTSRRVLGVDPGTHRIGLAISDEDGLIAQPLATLARRSDASAAQEIAKLVREREVGAVVVGLPLRLDGSEGDSARRARALMTRIGKAVGEAVTVVAWDERLTSVAANRLLASAGVREKERRGTTDRIAAALLLSGYLEASRRCAGDEAQDGGACGASRPEDGERSG